MGSRFSGRLLVALAALCAGCAALPSLEGRVATSAMTDTGDTRLGRAVAPALSGRPGMSGFHALSIPDAFAARVLLAGAAQKSLDLQYYIWHGDQTGNLLFEAVWRAAERGVRVRILLDDANTAGEDETIAALDAHPNIEVRLYNPLMLRGVRLLNFVTDFTRVNRRMHNMSFTADNQVTIVGGAHNIGNEYFGAGDAVEFTDLDVLGIGPVVKEVASEFDLHWNSASAYPAPSIVGAGRADARARLGATFAAARADPTSAAYVEALRTTQLLQQLVARQLPLEWANATVVRDDPAKALDTTARRDVLLLAELLPVIGPPGSSFDLVSPYFVPGDEGTAALERLAARGVEVRVLTNSLAATDVPAVHAGYARRRCDLLRFGVKLYELKPAARQQGERTPTLGSSSSVQLHAKTSALDRDRLFVGSFNFDQRSAFLNTEMGIVIDSPVLAQRLAGALDVQVPKGAAYEVAVAADGHCPEWIERTPAGEARFEIEPGTSAAQRGWIQFLEILPIEWLL